MGMSEQELEIHLQVPKRAGWPGRGWGRTLIRGPDSQDQVTLPCALLLSAGKRGGGRLELLTPSIAKLERARACRKMTLIPN